MKKEAFYRTSSGEILSLNNNQSSEIKIDKNKIYFRVSKNKVIGL